MRVRDGDAEAGPVEQLAVVLAVAARDRLRGRRSRAGRRRIARPAPLLTSGCANSRKYGSDFEMKSRPAKRGFSSASSASSAAGSPTATSFVGSACSQSRSGADGVDLEVLEVGVPPRLRRDLGDVQLVVDVAVEVEAGRDDGVDRLERALARDGDVAEELAGRADRRRPRPGNRRRGRRARPRSRYGRTARNIRPVTTITCDACGARRARSPPSCAGGGRRPRRSASGRGRTRRPRAGAGSRREGLRSRAAGRLHDVGGDVGDLLVGEAAS